MLRRLSRAALAALAPLALLLTAAVPASAAAPRVDALTRLSLDTHRIAPGRTFVLDAGTQLVHGTLRHFAVVVHLPQGLRYVPDALSTDCRTSADRRTVRCASVGGGSWAGSQMTVAVSRSVRSGTWRTVTATADLGGAVAVHPASTTARDRLLVKPGADFGIHWIAPTSRLRPSGTPVVTRLVLTNHGRHRAYPPRVVFDLTGAQPAGFQLVGRLPAGCDSDSGEWDCGVATPVLPGRSVVFTFRWRITAQAAGKVLRIPVAFAKPVYLDPDPRNDSAPLVLRVAR